MSRFKTLLVISLILCALGSAKAQDTTKMAKVCFVRSTGYNGALLTFHCFVDSSLVCNLRNNEYSEHLVAPGQHQLDVGAYKKTYTDNKQSLPLAMVAGQTYYIKIMPGKGYNNKVKMVAVSETTIRPILAKCKLKTDCLE